MNTIAGSTTKPPSLIIRALFIIRILLGGFFVAVAVDKLLEPHQNFLYVVQGYQLFPEMIEEFVALVFPWIELVMGLFLFLGLWVKWTLRAYLLVLSMFILIITQALVRQLPIKYCGCFGGLFSSDIHHTLLLDLGMWFFVFAMTRFPDQTLTLSLDRYWGSEKKS